MPVFLEEFTQARCRLGLSANVLHYSLPWLLCHFLSWARTVPPFRFRESSARPGSSAWKHFSELLFHLLAGPSCLHNFHPVPLSLIKILCQPLWQCHFAARCAFFATLTRASTLDVSFPHYMRCMWATPEFALLSCAAEMQLCESRVLWSSTKILKSIPLCWP